jgi:predicted metal-dependent peptidase
LVEEEVVKENNSDWIQSLIQEHVLQAVFARIGERDKLESKRKTWNKIRKVEKV